MSLKLSENYNFSEDLIAHGTLNGVAVPFFATPEFRNELKEKFKLRPESDVFIVTYGAIHKGRPQKFALF